MDSAPANIDHATLAVSRWGPDGQGCAFVMRDVADELLPVGDSLIDEEQHLGFLSDLAAFSAANWNFVDHVGLLGKAERWGLFGSQALAAEEELGFLEPVPRIAVDGWARFTERAPADIAAVIDGLRRDAAPLVEALAPTPDTLLHGDWKYGNLGRSGRRTVLIDWCYMGAGPVAHELNWYLALNRARLPEGHTKESTIDDFIVSLKSNGIDPGDWWERQLAVCHLGALVEFGWEKAFGPDDELFWWCDRAREGARWL